MKPNETLLDTLLELQILDRVPRSGWVLRGVPEPESVSEHSWHVVFLVRILGDGDAELDLLRAIDLALVHDLAEVRLGDLPRTAGRYLPPGAKHAAERAAMAEILAPLGQRGEELYEEYRRGETREARLARACDKLALLLKVTRYESWGADGLGEFWENRQNFPEPGFPAIDEIIAALVDRRVTS